MKGLLWFLVNQVLGGLLLFVSTSLGFGTTGNGHFCLLAFCFVPSLLCVLLSTAPSSSWLFVVSSFLWAFVCVGFGYSVAFFHVFSTGLVMGISFFIALTVIVLVAAPFYRTFVRFEKRASSLGVVLIALIFPVLYTALFFLIFTYVSHIGDFPHPAYAYVALRPLIMFASFQGVSGVVFVVSLLGAAVWIAASQRCRDRDRAVLMVAVTVLLLATTYGSMQALACEGSFFARPTPDYGGDDVSIACFSEGLVRGQIDTLDLSGFALVLGGELEDVFDNLANLTNFLAPIAKRNGVAIVPGYANHTGLQNRMYHNQAALFNASGNLLYIYGKRYPAPGEEHCVPRRDGQIYVAPVESLGLVGAAICEDLNFPYYVGSAAKMDILVQPSNTWGNIGKFHALGNGVRAIEQGFALVRCGRDSFSGVALPTGEWRAFAPTTWTDPVMIARVPPFASCWTLYHTLGDVFGWICAALSALILISVVLPEAVLARLTPKIVRDALTSKYTPFLDQPMN